MSSVTTDASSEGFGGWSEGDWFLGCWGNSLDEQFWAHNHVVRPPESVTSLPLNINTLELFAVVVALQRWRPHLGNSQIQVVTDNTQVVYMVNTGRSFNKTCMSHLREIFWLCFIFNVELFAVYINTKENVFADALSKVSSVEMRDLVVDSITNLNLCCHDHFRALRRGLGKKGE